MFFKFHCLVSIAYGTTRPRCERKTFYILFIFHGLVSIAYGTTRPRCERMTGYYFISRSGFNHIWYDETTLWKNDWLLFYFTVWFQSHMVRRDHVGKEWLVILFHGLFLIAYGTTRLCCERMTGYYFISRSGFNLIWYDKTMLWKNDWLLFYITVWFQSYLVRRDHVVKEWLVILFHGLFLIAYGTTRLCCERQVIILYHGLVSIAYGTTRPRCERMTGYFISRSVFNRIWYDKTMLWKTSYYFISRSGFNRIWYDKTTLSKKDWLLFYFTVWFQSHMVRRDHVVKNWLCLYFIVMF